MSSCDEGSGAYSDMEEEEEVVELSESDLLKLLDQQEPALQVCSRLFRKATEKEKLLSFIDASEWFQLRLKGLFVKDACLSEQQSRELHSGAMKLHARGCLEEANKVRLMPDMSLDKCTDTSARGDQITWLHEGDDFRQGDSAGMHAMQVLQALQDDLHGIMELKKRQAEYQLAVYMGGGSQYVKHRDALPDDGASANERRVTAILYANPDWQSEHGGQLRIWVPPTASSMSASSIANDDHVDQLDHFVLRPSNQSATSATSSAESPCSLTGAHVTSAAATEQQSPAHVRNAGASAQASQDNHGAAQQLNGSDLEQQDSRPPQAHNDSVGEQLNSLHIEDNGSAEQDHCQATQSTNGQHSRPSQRQRHGVYEHTVDGEQVVDIDPLAGRMVVFLSGAIDHAVLPSHKPRVAVTAWCQ